MTTFKALAIVLTSSALAQTSQPSIDVRSSNQSGGVTAGTITNFNQYLSASDIEPSLVSELLIRKASKKSSKLYLSLRNPSRIPIDLIDVRFSSANGLRGLERSYGRRLIRGQSSVEIALFDTASHNSEDLRIVVSFRPRGAATLMGFTERYIIDADQPERGIQPNEHVDSNPSEDRAGPFIETGEEAERPKGEYIFTIPTSSGEIASGRFDTYYRFVVYSSENQILAFASRHGGKMRCLAAPLLPRPDRLRRVRVYWDESKDVIGMSIDKLEVTKDNGVLLGITFPSNGNRITCGTMGKLDYEGLIDYWK